MTFKNSSNRNLVLASVLSGVMLGMALVGSLFIKPLYALFLVPFLKQKTIVSNGRSIISLSAVTMILWILTKSALVDSINYSLIYAIFPWFVLGFFIHRAPDVDVLKGIFVVVAVLFLTDLLFNGYSIYTGADPLGRAPSIRQDSIFDRRGGVMAHSFFSIVISITVALFLLLFRRYFLIGVALVVINIIITGAFRGAIYILFFVGFWIFVQKKSGFVHLLYAIMSGVAVFILTWLTTQVLDFEDNVSNEFRVKAWTNAIELIWDSPLLGTYIKFYDFDDDIGVNEINMLESGTAESALLGDALRWGLAVVAVKVAVFSKLCLDFKSIETRLLGRGLKGSVKEIQGIQFIPVFIIFDYMMGSAYGSVLFASVSALFIAYGLSVGIHRGETGRS